jgi:hypothetical protein
LGWRSIRGLVVAVFAVAALSMAGTAWGKCRRAHTVPGSVQQYIERPPTVCGPKSTDKGGGYTKLPAPIDQALGHGGEAKVLRKVATSRRLGAPDVKREPANAGSRPIEQSGPNPLSAVGNVVAGGSDGRLIALLSVMGAIVLVAGYAAYRRRFGRR